MTLPGRAFLDPALEEFDLLGRKGIGRFGWRSRGVTRCDPSPKVAQADRREVLYGALWNREDPVSRNGEDSSDRSLPKPAVPETETEPVTVAAQSLRVAAPFEVSGPPTVAPLTDSAPPWRRRNSR